MSKRPVVEHGVVISCKQGLTAAARRGATFAPAVSVDARLREATAEINRLRAMKAELVAALQRAIDENRCGHAADPCSWCEPVKALLAIARLDRSGK